jgi:hypothetical protein
MSGTSAVGSACACHPGDGPRMPAVAGPCWHAPGDVQRQLELLIAYQSEGHFGRKEGQSDALQHGRGPSARDGAAVWRGVKMGSAGNRPGGQGHLARACTVGIQTRTLATSRAGQEPRVPRRGSNLGPCRVGVWIMSGASAAGSACACHRGAGPRALAVADPCQHVPGDTKRQLELLIACQSEGHFGRKEGQSDALQRGRGPSARDGAAVRR